MASPSPRQPPSQLLEARTTLFRALGDPTRQRLLAALAEAGPRNVTELCRATGLEQSRASHHLACLRNCGLVTTEREGKQIIYAVNGGERLAKLLELADEHISESLEGILACFVKDEGE